MSTSEIIKTSTREIVVDGSNQNRSRRMESNYSQLDNTLKLIMTL